VHAYLPSLLCVGLLVLILPWLNPDGRPAKRFIAWAFGVLQLLYLGWRAARTMPAFELHWQVVLAYVWFLFEVWTGSLTMRYFWRWGAPLNRSAEADKLANWYGNDAPLIDFLIPTYNEKWEVIEASLISALGQDYPNSRVWLLDDGKRDWLRKRAEEMGAHYLTRPNNVGFKAGNLNHAFHHVMGLPDPPKFLAVLDCDFVAHRTFLSRGMCLMGKSDVGIVQTPQMYYNEDLFQYTLKTGRTLPDWMRIQFDFVLPLKDRSDNVTCNGTVFIIRVSALETIGEFPMQSLAEDALTSLALKAHGFKTVYLNEPLGYGIVAEGLKELLTQCNRWCLGNVQNLYTPWGPMHLPFWKALSAMELTISWGVFSAMKLVQIWLPALFWFYGPDVLAFRVPVAEFPMYFFPPWIIQIIGKAFIQRGRDLPIIADARGVLTAWVVTRATWRGLVKSKNHRFEVTDKGILRGGVHVHWHLLSWVLLLLALTIGGMFYRLAVVPQTTLNGMAYFWSVYNVLTLLVCVVVCLELPRRRVYERFSSTEQCELRTASGSKTSIRLRDISVGGVRVSAHGAEGLVAAGQGELCLQSVGWLSVRYVRQDGADVCLAFQHDAESRARLTMAVYTTRFVDPVYHGAALGAYWATFKRIFV
jgi:cellulose synthase (UDP-forming)